MRRLGVVILFILAVGLLIAVVLKFHLAERTPKETGTEAVAPESRGRPFQQAATTIQHTSRTGRRYYLHARTTAAGKASYFFPADVERTPAAQVPEGYEVFETA